MNRCSLEGGGGKWRRPRGPGRDARVKDGQMQACGLKRGRHGGGSDVGASAGMACARGGCTAPTRRSPPTTAASGRSNDQERHRNAGAEASGYRSCYRHVLTHSVANYPLFCLARHPPRPHRNKQVGSTQQVQNAPGIATAALLGRKARLDVAHLCLFEGRRGRGRLKAGRCRRSARCTTRGKSSAHKSSAQRRRRPSGLKSSYFKNPSCLRKSALDF